MSKQLCPGKRAAKLTICDSGNGIKKKLAHTNIQSIVNVYGDFRFQLPR